MMVGGEWVWTDEEGELSWQTDRLVSGYRREVGLEARCGDGDDRLPRAGGRSQRGVRARDGDVPSVDDGRRRSGYDGVVRRANLDGYVSLCPRRIPREVDERYDEASGAESRRED